MMPDHHLHEMVIIPWDENGPSHGDALVGVMVSEAVAAENQKVVDADPCARPTKHKKCRERDRKRTDGKVLNPLLTSLSPCIVCKFFFRKKKPTKTSRYCRECMTDPAWPETTRAKGWQKKFHPRLCSTKCFEIFHNTRISGLDYRVEGRRKRKRRSKRISSSTPSPTDSSKLHV